MPDEQTNAKRKEAPSRRKSFISSFERFHHDDYLFMFLQTPILSVSRSFFPFPSPRCVSVYGQKTHFPTLIVYRFPTSRGFEAYSRDQLMLRRLGILFKC
jgi:hypothetical protein